MASAGGRDRQPVHRGKIASWLSKIFELHSSGLNWPRAVLFLDVALVPLVVVWAIGHEVYLLSALFGVLFSGLADPGGGFGYRASRVAIFALVGAGLTALGFGIGADAWGWLVLAAFAVTLATGLTVMFGVGVLILVDLPQPANYAAEGYRVLWTLCGVAIGVLVMLLAGLLAKRAARTPPQQATQPA